MRIAVVGSGFGGSIAARVLARLGHRVSLLEKGSHPRFALGESTTPLANLALERLAARYRLPDLHQLAAYGRWMRSFPELQRGLKRGFTFYRHMPGSPFEDEPNGSARALIAASPEDAMADSHWLRSDLDHHFVRQAEAEGVDVRQRCEVREVERRGEVWRVRGEHQERSFVLDADFLIDATGPAGVLPGALGIPDATDRLTTRSGLVFSHFDGVRRFEEVSREEGTRLPPGPYADDAAAVHHLLDEGWMYVLRFDSGVVSAGVLFDGELPAGSAEEIWRGVLGRYPSLAKQFAEARPLFPLKKQARIQHRQKRAVGEGWLLLPHTFAFVDPLYSTGIAWTLIGIERIARIFAGAIDERPAADLLTHYEERLQAEADRIDRLVHLAYRARGDFRLLVAVSFLYFAAVSWAESRKRLVDGGDDPWDGFLGVDDPVFDSLFLEAPERLDAALDGSFAVSDFEVWIREGIESRNVAGLADPGRCNLYPADLDLLVEWAPLLGLTPEQVRARLPRLRA